MPDWTAFAGFTGVVLALLLLLARLSQSAITGGDAAADGGLAADDGDAGRDRDLAEARVGPVRYGPLPAENEAPEGGDPRAEGPADAPDATGGQGDRGGTPDEAPAAGSTIPDADSAGASRPPDADSAGASRPPDADSAGASRPPDADAGDGARTPDGPSLSTPELLANVAASQGAFGLFLLFAVWLTGVPLSALGVPSGGAVLPAIGTGAAVGVALYALNEAGATAGERLGLGSGEELRAALAPDSAGSWLLLLGVVLPLIAGFEELLFRGALVGAMAAGFGVSPWLLAAGSSVAFALGHGAQGPAGIVVTGVLGFALAAVFVLTGSLLTVVVAHYLVNALEFVVHEGPGLEWPG